MIISRTELTRKLKQLKGLTPPKTTMTIAGVLIKDGKIIATNAETTVTADIDLPIEEPFILPLSAMEMLEKLACDEVDISVKNNKVKIKHKNGTSNFSTVNCSEFPNLIENISFDEGKNVVSCTGSAFAEYISRVTHISDNSSGRVIANAVCITGMNSGPVEFATCDGRACAYIQGLKALDPFKVIIQTATIKKVVSLIENSGNDEFGFYLPDGKHAVFKSGDYTIYANLVAANFIDYKSVFPKEPKAVFTAEIPDLIKILDRAVICSDMLSPTVITAQGSSLSVSVRSSVSDFSEETTLSDDLGNNEVRIGVNAKLFITMLKASDEEKIRMSFTSDVQPLVIDDGLLHQIIMPVRLGDKR